MRKILGLSVALAMVVGAMHAPPAHASNSFKGNVKAMAVMSVTMTAFAYNNCQPVAALQGVDGLVVPVGSARTFTVTASSQHAAGYAVRFYDGACRLLGVRTNVEGNSGTDAYFTPDKSKTPPTVNATLPVPAKWVVIHAGWGIDVDFSVTWS